LILAPLSEAFIEYIRAHRLFDPKARLTVAVSGGLDSVVLVKLLHDAGYTFTIAHCHFGLRGWESDRDALFVQQLAAAYNAAFLINHFDTKAFALEQKLSIQEAARKLRYDWFAHIINKQLPNTSNSETAQESQKEKVHSSYLLTAHHMDDNIETVLMNFFKGTGISGIRGMLSKKGHVVRPLLFARRNELELFAKEKALPWVEDSSNKDTKYTRNFFRHEVVPLVARRYPQALENIAANISRFQETETLYQQAIEAHRKNILEYRGNEILIPVLKLERSKPLSTITFELLKPYGFTAAQTGAVLQLRQSESGRFVRSATHQIVRHRKWLVIAPLHSAATSMLVIEKEQDIILYDGKVLKIETKPVPKSPIAEKYIAFLDAGLLQFPMILRRWKKGDYFYPLGMRKKKKISRFLIDQKFSLVEKEAVWVVESGKKIAWVVGLRIDDRFKITSATQNVYQLTSSPFVPDKTAHP
jgi:tRNA(Ile)-lysidine synthase